MLINAKSRLLNLGYERYQSEYIQQELYHHFPQYGFRVA